MVTPSQISLIGSSDKARGLVSNSMIALSPVFKNNTVSLSSARQFLICELAHVNNVL